MLDKEFATWQNYSCQVTFTVWLGLHTDTWMKLENGTGATVESKIDTSQ